MYLDETTYKEWGGQLEQTAFNRYCYRASRMIDTHTSNRLKDVEVKPEIVKRCVFEIIEYLAANIKDGAALASHSETAGAVTQTDTYVVKSIEAMEQDIEAIICDYLLPTGLLYRGAADG